MYKLIVTKWLYEEEKEISTTVFFDKEEFEKEFTEAVATIIKANEDALNNNMCDIQQDGHKYFKLCNDWEMGVYEVIGKEVE